MKIFLFLFLIGAQLVLGCPSLAKIGKSDSRIHIAYPKDLYVDEARVQERYNYTEKNFIGNGSIGSVWLGTMPENTSLEGHYQPRPGTQVAVKRPLFDREKWIHHEAVIAERLAQNDPERLFVRTSYDKELNVLVCEYLEGMQTLEEFKESFSSQGVPKEAQEKIIIQMAAALDILHSVHLVHGDLKPDNIMIDPKTYRIKIIDYSLVAPIGGYPLGNGVGKLRGGSERFASKDQRMGQPAKFSDDLYSFEKLKEYLSHDK